MATVTPNFNWPVPTSTDLVKDGATAIEALGDSIDASLVDLKGGTSGQVLSKNSNTDMDFVWVTSDDANAIQNTIVDAKGDLITATAADTPARLAVGANGETLVADSSTATGLKWTTTGQAMTLVKRASFSAVANTGTTFDDVFTSTYKSYQVVFEVFGAATTVDDVHFQLRYAGPTTQAADYYGNNVGYVFNSTAITNTNASGTAQALFSTNSGDVLRGAGTFFVAGVGVVGAAFPNIQGTYGDASGAVFSNSLYTNITARNYTGFILKSSSSNISGTVAVYGLA
jgi:hypothetical protein